MGSSIEQATDIKADLYTFSKGLANGNRISCLVGRNELMSKASNFTFTSFYNAIPFYAAVTTLKKMKENKGYEYLNEIGEKLSIEMNCVLAESEIPIRVFGQGPMLQFVCANDELEEEFYHLCTENGLLLFERDNQAMSCAIDDDAIAEVCDILKDVTEKLAIKFPQYKNANISSKRVFSTAWDMIDGAADIGKLEDKIEWIKELM